MKKLIALLTVLACLHSAMVSQLFAQPAGAFSERAVSLLTVSDSTVLKAGTLFIEAEDFNYNKGLYITNRAIGMTGTYTGGSYRNLGNATDKGIDFNDDEAVQGQTYRAATGVEAGNQNGPAGLSRGVFSVRTNNVVGWNNVGDWFNYTRNFPQPAKDYYVYARLSSGGQAEAAQLDEVTSGAKTRNQTLRKLGEFRASATGSWDRYHFVALKNSQGEMVKVTLGGEKTLRFTILPGNLDVDYLAFVPAPETKPLVAFGVKEATVGEASGQSGMISVTRSGSTSQSLTVKYSVQGRAVAGADYQSLSGTLTIPAGSPSASITVKPINDTESEGIETVQINLSQDAAYDLGSEVTATIIIQDDEPALTGGTINFATRFVAAGVDAPVFDVDGTTKLQGSAFLAQLYAGADANNLRAIGSSAPFFTGAGAGYVQNTQGTVIAAGITPGQKAFVQMRVWAAASGSTYEQALAAGGKIGSSATIEVVTGGAGTPPSLPANLVGLRSFSLMIPTANTKPLVAFGVKEATVGEASGQGGTITVTRTGSTSQSLTVKYSIQGRAAAGTDYQSLSGTLTIPAGSQSASITVKPINDSESEGIETVQINLTQDAAYDLGTEIMATVIIQDDEPALTGGTINFATRFVAAGVDAPVFDVDGTTKLQGSAFLAQLYAGTDAGNLRAIGSPAPFFTGAGAGYVQYTQGPVIAAGIAPGQKAFVQLRVWAAASGSTYEQALSAKGKIGSSTTIEVVLGGAGSPPSLPANLVGLRSFSLMIPSANTKPLVAFGVKEATVGEASGQSGTITVTRTGSTTQSLSVKYSVQGRAAAGTDYQSLSGTLTIPAGSQSASITVSPINDTESEGVETVQINLTLDAAYDLGTEIMATVIIQDDEPALTGGTINFATRFVAAGVDAPVFDVDGTTKLQGSAFLAQLYAGTDTNNLRAIGSPAPFFTGAGAGYVQNTQGTVIAAGITPGQKAFVQMRVWAAASGSTYEQALAAGGKIGSSATIEVVTGGAGSPPSLPANLVGLKSFSLSIGQSVKITQQPEDTSVVLGGNATFTVVASGTGNISYQWRHNGIDLNGQTSATLQLNNVTGVQAGKYTVLVRTASGSLESSPATLIVTVAPFVTRQLPGAYTPGTKVQVSLKSTPPTGASSYGVEEQVPTGWTVGVINEEGILDTANGRVVWIFIDGQPRTLTYELTPPANATNTVQFVGVASVDGAQSQIAGTDTLKRGSSYHPADLNPTDYNITLPELTGYITAYKRGQSWPVAPSPIPISYVTRAMALYRGGGTYQVDGSISSAPAWWVNTPVRKTSLLMVGTQSAPQAQSPLPAFYIPGEEIEVKIDVTPASGSFYAVEDQVPEGWTVSGITDGGEFDQSQSKVKWVFLDNKARSLSYKVVPPVGAKGQSEFIGVASFDGADALIGGSRKMLVGAKILPDIRFDDKGQASLGLAGELGATYVIEASNDLVNWTVIQTIVNVTGVMTVKDVPGLPTDSRFYRARKKE